MAKTPTPTPPVTEVVEQKLTPADFPEIEMGIVTEAEPVRMSFQEVDSLPEEPTDVVIELSDGTKLRERLQRVHLKENPAGNGESTVEDGFNFSISNALLDDKGKVARDTKGNLKIVPAEVRHEIRLTGEDLAVLGTPEKVQEVLQIQREVAAAKAHRYFFGMELGNQVFGKRLE